MDVNKLYSSHEKLIYKHAENLARKTGIDLSETVGMCNLAFTEAASVFDEKKGAKLSSIFCKRATWAVMRYAERHDPPTEYKDENEDQVIELTPHLHFKDMISLMNSDAQQAVDILLSAPDELIEYCGGHGLTGKAMRHGFKFMLWRRGWKDSKIRAAFKSIKLLLTESNRYQQA